MKVTVLFSNTGKFLFSTLVSIRIKSSSLMTPDALLCNISSWSEENCNTWQTQQRDDSKSLQSSEKWQYYFGKEKSIHVVLAAVPSQTDSILFLHLHFHLCFRIGYCCRSGRSDKQGTSKSGYESVRVHLALPSAQLPGLGRLII